jgi:GWxTD domain-containing protein
MSLSGSRIRIITCITQIWLLMLVPSVKTIFAETLSNEAQISILTVDSGKEIWTVFGHTAIRIHDPINNIDEVYNYGTFDFDQNRFYLKFLRGNLIYYLSRDSFDHFLKTYTAVNRTIWEQQLLFQSEVLQKLFDSLSTNYHSGNRDYYYNFFEDNCTTRILNLIIAFASEKCSEEYLLQPVNSTYRKELKPILLNRPWIAFGVNLLLGRYGDQHINLRQSMFLPVTLMKKLPGTGWTTEGATIYKAKTAPSQAKEFFMPITIFWIEVAGNERRGFQLLENYYDLVKDANLFFTSYKEGWKTDRGMIYMIFGAPTEVFKKSEIETWIYGDPQKRTRLHFDFIQNKNPFTTNDFELVRQPDYKNPYFVAVDYLRR